MYAFGDFFFSCSCTVYHVLKSHGPLTSWRQWVVKHLSAVTIFCWSLLFISLRNYNQSGCWRLCFVLTTAFFNLSWSYSQEKSPVPPKKLCSHSFIPNVSCPFVRVNSSLLDKAFGRVPQGQLHQFGFPKLVYLSLSMVRGWLSQSQLTLFHIFLKTVKFHLKDFMAESLHLKSFPKSNRNS